MKNIRRHKDERIIEKVKYYGKTYYINIHRTNYNYNDGSYTIKCSAIQYITGINLRGPVAVITKGQSMNLLTSITPSNASQKTLRWSSNDRDVVTISGNGMATGKKFKRQNPSALKNRSGMRQMWDEGIIFFKKQYNNSH